ncbi:uncharacterized protein LOC116263073 [Nymphaea colorata]|nr:uncharacterized protein LOC116263073 [Nymphaea colorata]XP_031498517.1 uncharacterized protein LOC116263073 [Nymphaea colorata]
MSLSLLQGYSSEGEVDDRDSLLPGSDTDDAVREEETTGSHAQSSTTSHDLPETRLPSAADAFSIVTGPPEFLKNCLAEQVTPAQSVDRRGRKHGSNRRSKEPPPGGVVEAKAQLVGFHERVRNDLDSLAAHLSTKSATGEGKQKHGVTLPGPQDAADLLRMCLQCGVPKTYTSARGVVCPICGDQPPNPEKETERKRSTIKDKEKSKRMKGQSSHATWKSETEMQLRQQFD